MPVVIMTGGKKMFSVLYTDPKIYAGEEQKKKVIEFLKQEYNVTERMSPYGCYSLSGNYKGKYNKENVNIHISNDSWGEVIAEFKETVITSPYNQLETTTWYVRVENV